MIEEHVEDDDLSERSDRQLLEESVRTKRALVRWVASIDKRVGTLETWRTGLAAAWGAVTLVGIVCYKFLVDFKDEIHIGRH